MSADAAAATGSRDESGYPYAPAEPIVIDRASLEVRDTVLPPLLLPAAMGFACVLADFVVAPLMYRLGGVPPDWSIVFVMICLGLIGTQAAVLSAWLVWGEGPFLWRVLIHWGIAAVCCWIWIGGLATCARGTELIDGHCVAALSLAIISAAIQAPLWLTRQVFAWRLVRPEAAAVLAPEKTSTIGNLMLAISVAAVALAFARLVPTDVDPSELIAMWSFIAGWSAAIGALGVLPIAAFLLWPRSIGRGLAWSAVHALVVVVAVWSVIVGISIYQKLKIPLDMLGQLTVLMLCFYSGLALWAIAARGLDYRLILGKASRQPQARAAHQSS